MEEQDFKICQVCGRSWRTRDEFIADDEISLIGYQANFVALEKGLFLFNHSCRGTLSAGVYEFSDLYTGPIFSERMPGEESCSEQCLHPHLATPCPNRCECAYVREILRQLQKKRRNEPLIS